MKHTLVLPEELNSKLLIAEEDPTIVAHWNSIGVNNSTEMLEKTCMFLNEYDKKLNIVGYYFENEDVIKERVKNGGQSSQYAGFIVDEREQILALFFYVEPNKSSGNDLLTRNIWASLIGIHRGFSEEMYDLHFTSRPVYVVNMNETNRPNQNSFKISAICLSLLGFKYIDMYNREYRDVIPNYTAHANPVELVKTLRGFSNLISTGSRNNYFEIDQDAKKIKILSDRLISSNPSAEAYRFISKIIPVSYIAKDCGYKIDFTELFGIKISAIETLKRYLNRLNM
ncbi:TPA: hypothetical protein ACGOY9_000288 [Streptococcus suis]|nr:hypothetical protein [Streptococcus suis]HEM4148104.1 hypothetical protein [Streptococcus suis]